MRTKMRTVTRHRLCIGGMYGLIVIVIGAMFSETFLNMLARWAAVVAVALGVAGCSTISFTSPEQPSSVVSQTVTKPPASKVVVPEEVIKPEPVASSIAFIRHGRFTVRLVDGGQVIEGGVFTPPETMPVSSNAAHVLIVNYTTKELRYYRKVSAGLYEPVIGYAVMTPEPSFLPRQEVRGMVRDIDTKPSWCPKAQARRIYKHLPKGCLPPGHPDNMMGDAKFLINWQGIKGWEAIHLHGTSGYKLGAFWEQETLGCTRLTNEAIRKLIELLGPYAVKEGIEVILERGNTFLKHAL